MRARRLLTFLAPIIVATVLSSGCALKRSKQAQIYVLDSIAAAGDGAATLRDAPLSVVGVLRVTVPGWIDRPEITRRGEGGEIVADDFARWGEPIGRGIQRVLTENLATLLPDRLVVAAPFAPRLVVHHRVDVTITEATRQTDGTVLVEARFAWLGPKGRTLVQQRSSHRSKAALAGSGGTSGETATRTSEALAGLSRDIADALRSLPPLTEGKPEASRSLPAQSVDGPGGGRP
jgi:uncharacterized lipoprotein YmbA